MGTICISYAVLQQQATRLGFEAFGVVPVEKLSQDKVRLLQWLNTGKQAGMSYMERNVEKREDPSLLVKESRSVIVTLMNYYHPDVQAENMPHVSRYAYGKDYHGVIKQRLRLLMAGMEGRCFVDSAPVMEKEWARRAGLGWIGKNTLLLHRRLGSFCFIGVIITPAVFDRYSLPLTQQYCGTCKRCVEACPTGALSPYELDANKCISYHTIENKGDYPWEIRRKAGKWIFGCDICQEVCPWNGHLKVHQIPEFMPNPKVMQMTDADWKKLDETAFHILFKDTPLERTGLKRILRNLP